MDIVERLRTVDISWSETGEWCAEAADEIELLRKERDGLREALHAILCNTDPHAIRHRDYDHLAKNIFDCATAALKEIE